MLSKLAETKPNKWKCKPELTNKVGITIELKKRAMKSKISTVK